MVQPLTGHPAADRITPAAVITEQTRQVVPRSAWLADAAVTAARSGRTFQLVTPAASRITYPLELMLTETGGRWVIRAGDTARDGLTSQPLHWDDDRYTELSGVVPAAPLAPDSVWGGSADIQITTLHPADAALELGATTEAAVRALTGREPAGWGVAEPVTQPWSRRELTNHCRHRAPAPSSLVVIGDDVLGVVNVKRVRTGVLEEVRLSGPPFLSAGESAYESLADEVAGTARSMIVAIHHGRIGGLRTGAPTLPPLPYAVLIGHQAPPGTGITPPITGRGLRGGTLWYRLDDGPGQPYEALTAVLQAYGLPVPTR
ncbi:DUF6177 family protein [Actinoplanes utahensis]|uniref:Uncharacterized protein n=1 Tax=Actinoplanes utahensis TaxID=1869 RepID=A0A0A6UQT0_ACTUT|nr:DUF6177 family protein [Actinoplanes utahensis]KHD78500.1 hypothetical protein MB27_04620 [Actinoplanes utahensis]GIF31832.1 hypothetical protein Aut01nite_48180 [Actinoplanes utahensis]